MLQFCCIKILWSLILGYVLRFCFFCLHFLSFSIPLSLLKLLFERRQKQSNKLLFQPTMPHNCCLLHKDELFCVYFYFLFLFCLLILSMPWNYIRRKRKVVCVGCKYNITISIQASNWWFVLFLSQLHWNVSLFFPLFLVLTLEFSSVFFCYALD